MSCWTLEYPVKKIIYLKSYDEEKIIIIRKELYIDEGDLEVEGFIAFNKI